MRKPLAGLVFRAPARRKCRAGKAKPVRHRNLVLPPPAGWPADRGSVTVEAALVLSAMALVLVLGAAAVNAVLGQLRCVDAAREAARLVARGEAERVAEAVHRIGPARAEFSVTRDGDTVRVEVAAAADAGLLPGIRPRAEAYAVLEPELVESGQATPGPPTPPGSPATRTGDDTRIG
ncbi:pilus assembly protein [Goodfellowiella coeruleoviolacea]|uniref:TadE-like protein n=1 Tax=Goodfellowiella coeruleoviolacea TaxID=334858 RepID=A0AAE3KJS2_9PSEU|nr:pilus assembly protein [Goodfellowiella coeruleoviolacea]MCP2164633.1 TadE-like protein [Goodfellowiella coeruleoviolacea]